MELLTVTLAASQTRHFAKAGRYFEIIDSTYAVNVAFTGADGGQSDTMTGALSGLFIEGAYSAFALTNGSIAQTVTLLVMENSRGGSRRQPGVVTVIDAAKKRSQNQQAFLGPFTQIVAAGGQNPTLQLFNASNSGVIAYVSRVEFYSTAAQLVRFGHNDTILSTITGSPGNKYSGGVAGSLIYANQSMVGTPANFAYWGLYLCAANATVRLDFPEPIILPLGRALVLQGATAGGDLGGNVEYTQEAV